MPQVFQPTYRDKKTGQTVHTAYWFARIHGKRVPMKTKDKRIAERKAVEMERASELGYDPQAQDRARRRPIIEHLMDFENSLRDQGVGEGHLKNLVPRLRKMFVNCSMKTLADVATWRIEQWLAKRERKGMAVGTRKHYASNCKQFGAWLLLTGRMGKNPFAELKTDLNIEAHRKYVRRALSLIECQKLLATTRRSKKIMGTMTGEERYHLYSTAMQTGFRRDELASLTPASFALEVVPATITVVALETKNKRKATLPIRADLANELRPWLADKETDATLWPIKNRRMGYVIQFDLAAAGIPYSVDGRVMDFHALRGTYCTQMVRSGVPLVVAQKLMRHSDPRLTACTYTDLGMADLSSAVESMPSLGE